MNRRGFFRFLGFSIALMGTGLNGLRSTVAQIRRALFKTFSPERVPVYRTSVLGGTEGATRESAPFAVNDLLARSTLPLGRLHSYRCHVSLDDIAKPDYLAHIGRERNALVISAYNEDNVGTALLRAVLAKLSQASQEDYRKVGNRLLNQTNLRRGQVIHFGLRVQSGARQLFPIDDLVAVILEFGERVDWVSNFLGIADQQGSANVIVPCLGRNWRDRHTVSFRDFFISFVEKTPAGKKPANIYFSLYSEWPSFELEDAVTSLNAVWRKRPA